VTWLRRALARLTRTVRGHGAAAADLRAEMEAHLAMAMDEFRRRGMAPDEARRQALRAAGNLTQAAEVVRAERALPWAEAAVADARFAARHWRRAPLATLTMLLVLSLGIGTSVVVFTILDSIATRPAPGLARDAAVVRIRGVVQPAEATSAQPRLLSWPEIEAYAARTDLFSSVAAHADESAMAVIGDAATGSISASVVYVSGDYFATLNIQPQLGTIPPPEPDVTRLTTAPTAMISHVLWTQRFGGAPDVLGRMMRINGSPVQIVGVAPPRFLGTDGGTPLTVWLPLAAYPLLQQRTGAVFLSPDSLFLSATARLAPGITAGSATPVVAALAARTAARTAGAPTAGRATGADVVPLLASNARLGDRTDQVVSSVAATGFALLVLLITCTNVSALMVGLAAARRREIGVRLALGAPRGRLVRQLLTESILLALVAAGLGLLATTAGIQVFGTALDDVQLVVDWRVTLAAAAVAIVTGILFGLSPALHATRVPVNEVLRSSSASIAATRSRLQRGLVVAQVALTQPLLVGLGVVVMTTLTDLGSRARSEVGDQIAEIELDTWAGRVSMAERASRINDLVTSVRGLPGVVAAMPMQAGTVRAPLIVHPVDRLEGISPATVMDGHLQAAPTGFFNAFGIPIVRGRDFESAETVPPSLEPGPPSHGVVIIGNDLARRLWGDADPIGRRLALATTPPSAGMTVVGVVDAAATGPSEVGGQVRVYVPYASIYTGVLVRTAGPALSLLPALRAAATTTAPQLPVKRAETMAQREADTQRRLQRTSGAVAGGGMLALLLAALGLYAAIAFSVGQRTREIGIRAALGARRGQVMRLFFLKGLALTGLGLLLGLPLSILVIRYVSLRLQWPLPSPPLLGVAIAGVVLAVASLAVWIPSRRASTIEPLVALRAE
jgi:predicted permease